MIAANPRFTIRLLDNEKRIPAAALNLAIQQARGDMVLRLDAHCEGAPDFVRKNVEVLLRTGAACVGGCVTSVGEGRTGRAVALAMSSPFGVGNAHFRYAREERVVDAVAYGAYRRSVFGEIGLYDEDLVYSEDNELNDRLTRAGRKVLLSPEIRVTYFARETLGALWRQYFNYGFGRVRYMVRAPASVRLRHVAPLALVLTLVTSLALGVLDRRFLLVFAGVIAAWIGAALLASVRICLRQGWESFLRLPAAFACQHFGYGVGQFAGALDVLLSLRPGSKSRPAGSR